jgi:hypothetical protein
MGRDAAASAARPAGFGAFAGLAAGVLAASAAVVISPFSPSRLLPTAMPVRIAPAAVAAPQPEPATVQLVAALALPVAPRDPPTAAFAAALQAVRPLPLAAAPAPPPLPPQPVPRIASAPQLPVEIRPGRAGRAPILIEALPGAPIIPPVAPSRPAGDPPPPRAALPLDIELSAPWAARFVSTRADPPAAGPAATAPHDD